MTSASDLVLPGLVLVVLLCLYIHRRLRKRIGRQRAELRGPDGAPMPGPPAGAILGNLVAMGKQGLPDWLAGVMRDYGGIASVFLGPKLVVFVSDPEALERMLLRNAGNYTKGTSLEKSRPYWGDGLVMVEGERWKRQRRTCSHAFSSAALRGMVPGMAIHTQELLDKWEGDCAAGRTLNLYNDMKRVVLDIIAEAAFGYETHTVLGEGDEFCEAYDRCARDILRVAIPVLSWSPLLHLRFRRSIRTLERLIYRIIDARRSAGSSPSGNTRANLLELLVNATDPETGESLSREELRDEVMTFMMAGHETTATLLTWCLFLLDRNPGARARCEDEIREVLGDKPRAPTAEELPRFEYTRMVLRESLRIYSPAVVTPREASGEDTLLGYRIPAGTWMMYSAYATHREPRYWPDPERFDPERFSPERAAGRHRFAYLPFGGGRRQCIGERMAMMEATLILVMIVQRFRVRVSPEFELKTEVAATLQPKGGLPVTLERREPAA